MSADNSVFSFDDLVRKTDAIEVAIEQMQTLRKEAVALAAVLQKKVTLTNPNDTEALKKQAQEVAKLEAQLLKLKVQEKEARLQRKKAIDLSNEELIAIQKNKIAQRERTAIAKQNAIIQVQGAKSIAGLRAQLALTTIEWKKITEAESLNEKEAKKLVARKLDLTKRLKKLEEATDDSRRSVGKYSDALGGLGKTAARVFIGRSIVDGIRRISSFVVGLIEESKDSSKALLGLSNSISKATSAFKAVAVQVLEFVAPALQFLADTATTLLGVFFDLEEEQEALVGTSDSLKETTKEITAEFGKEKGQLDVLFISLNNANEGSKERKNIIDQINDQYGKYLPNLLTEKSTLEEIAVAQELINEGLRKTFLLRAQEATQLDLVTNRANKTIEVFNKLRDDSVFPLDSSLSDFEEYINTIATDLNAQDAISNFLNKNLLLINEGLPQDAPRQLLDGLLASQTAALNEIQAGLGDFIEGLDRDQLTLVNGLIGDTKDFNGAIEQTNDAIQSIQGSLKTFDRSTSSVLKSSSKQINKSTDEILDNTSKRLAAIEELIRDVNRAEVENIKDKEERLIALEILRFKEQQRLLTERLDDLNEVSKGKTDELLQIEKEGQRLREEQEKKHKQNLLDIQKQFLVKRQDQEIKASNVFYKQIRDTQAAQEALLTNAVGDTQAKVQEAEALAAEKRKKDFQDDAKENAKLLDNIIQSSSESFQELFDNAVSATTKAVEDQLTAVERAEERAKLGLVANVKFEREQLAERQAEQQRAIKQQEQAAQAVAFLELVIAAARNGDADAVGTATLQFGLIQGIKAAITGSFFDGTEDTGGAGSWDAKGGKLAILHPHERVVPKFINEQLTGVDNVELPYLVNLGREVLNNNINLDAAHFKSQSNQIAMVALDNQASNQSNKAVIEQLKQVKQAILSIPTIDHKIEDMYKDVVTLTKKTTTKHMTKIETKKVQL